MHYQLDKSMYRWCPYSMFQLTSDEERIIFTLTPMSPRNRRTFLHQFWQNLEPGLEKTTASLEFITSIISEFSHAAFLDDIVLLNTPCAERGKLFVV